jgi:hypothetical protein
MKFSKYAPLILGILFGIGFITSLFKKHVPDGLYFFEISNIWIYRLYKLLFALFFIKIYFYEREENEI